MKFDTFSDIFFQGNTFENAVCEKLFWLQWVKLWCPLIDWQRHQNILNSLRPKQNGRHFPDDTFKCIFLNENVWIPIKISLKFVHKGPINNIPRLVQIITWRALQATSHYLNQWRLVYRRIYASPGLNELTMPSQRRLILWNSCCSWVVLFWNKINDTSTFFTCSLRWKSRNGNATLK